MRSASASRLAIVAMLGIAGVVAAAQAPVPIHRQRFAMWTVVDIVAYHPSRADAEAAIAKALD